MSDDLQSKIRSYLWGRNIAGIFDTDQVAEKIMDICLDHWESTAAYWINEIAYRDQLIEDMEIDHMLERESFVSDTSRHGIKPKRRSRF